VREEHSCFFDVVEKKIIVDFPFKKNFRKTKMANHTAEHQKVKFSSEDEAR